MSGIFDRFPTTRDDAIEALREAATEAREMVGETEETFDGDLIRETTVYRLRKVVHTFVNIDGVALGADHDLDEAIERVRTADAVFWVDHPLRHDLTVRVGDLNYFYAARRPK